jgi:addiction module RelE/StbE family toxin
MARIIWAPSALKDLEVILEYIAKDAPLTARRFGQKLLARADQLKTHPLLGGHVVEDATRTYRELLRGNYRIIYRFEGDAVYVVAIHHAARLLDVDKLP